jgi:hypothetical protein
VTHGEENPRPERQRRVIAAVLGLACALLCGLAAWDAAWLAAMGPPWRYAGSTLDPAQIPSATPSATPTPSPTPTPSHTPEPSETPVPLAALVRAASTLSSSRPCLRDQVALEVIQGAGAGQPGSTATIVSTLFCLRSQPEALVAVGLVPAGLTLEWQSLGTGHMTASSTPSLVQRSAGRVIQLLDWRAIPPGRYWMVAVLYDPQDLRVLSFGPGPEFTVGAGP